LDSHELPRAGGLTAAICWSDQWSDCNRTARGESPAPGQWGNAGRNTITGPSQFSLNASAQRTFRINDRFNATLQISSTNALNHPTFPSWVTLISSAQFGLQNPANPMRSVLTSVRVTF